MRVLVVDPCAERRAASAGLLAAHRFVPDEAGGWAEALRRIRDRRPVTVVAEAQEGQALITALQRDRELENIPIVGLMSEANPSLESGFCSILTVPYEPLEFLLAVLAVLDCHGVRVSMRDSHVPWSCPRTPDVTGSRCRAFGRGIPPVGSPD